MAKIHGKKDGVLVAKLVTSESRKPCAFCLREVDDEIIYGKLYVIGDIQCHYFCVLLSCCLIQKGRDHEGLFGFLYKDILIELERSKKHKCSYCGRGGANLGCSVTSCRKQFHLPCGREKNAVSLFYGTFKSYCQNHAPKQKIAEHVMSNVRLRRKNKNNKKCIENHEQDARDMVCVICYEEVDGYPTLQTFWPPCCARDAWFHRNCLQRMCLSAGMHYLKCPLCNDKSVFYEAVISQGYYVPDRDAAWELEQNAFAEIYERSLSCDVEECKCPMGRNHDDDTGDWCIVSCVLCGSAGAHKQCGDLRVCSACQPAAPADIHALTRTIRTAIEQEQVEAEAKRRRYIMPSRMSLRRTKGRTDFNQPSTSRSQTNTQTNDIKLIYPRISSETVQPDNKLPKHRISSEMVQPDIKLLSPLKLLERELKQNQVNVEIVEKLKEKFKKPRPLSVKKKLVNDLLEDFYEKNKEVPLLGKKKKEVTKEWLSPKKCTENQIEPSSEEIENKNQRIKSPTKNVQNITEIDQDDSSTSTFELPPEFIGQDSEDGFLFENFKSKNVDIQQDSTLEISENNESINIGVFKITPQKNKENIIKNEKVLDVENFKKEYLNEVVKDFKANHVEGSKWNLKTAIDYTIESSLKKEIENGAKRKLSDEFENVNVKRQKSNTEKGVISKQRKKKLKNNKKRMKKPQHSLRSSNKDIEVTIDSYEEKNLRNKNKKVKTKLSITNKNMKVKIQWRKEKIHLKFESNKKKNTKYSQYVLQYYKDKEGQSKEVLVKPEKEISPPKRKYIKQEKSPDKFKQTSLHNFFKVKPAE